VCPVREWHFLASTYNTGTIKQYFDGELVNTQTISPTSLSEFTHGIDFAADNLEEALSDVRIYVTELSVEDIKDLYNTPVNIDNLGNVHAFEFVEDNSIISIKENGQLLLNELNEMDFDKNAQFMQDNFDIIGNEFIEK